MKLKTKTVDGAEVAEVRNGKPIYVDDSGKEIEFDAPSAMGTISRLQGEAKGHRLGKEEAEAKLKAFEGIEDPAAAIKALNTVKNLNDKQLVDAGEVEKVKNEAIKAVEEKYKPVVQELDGLKATLNKEMIGGRFSRSKFIAEKIAVPTDFVEARFGSQFKIADGKVIATDFNGNQIYSKARPGEPADFDEALEILVSNYEHKDSILKGTGSSGSGAAGGGSGGGGSGGTGRKVSRREFDALPAAQKSTLMAKGEVTIVD